MTLPQVAIVGRPNVGKSSLLNRLARRRVSIVDPTPGVTRDRVSTVIEVDPPLETPKGTPTRLAEVIDTGGYGVYVAEGGRYDDVGADLALLTEDIERQINIAVENATVIVFVVDAQAGVTALDRTVADLLRKSGHAEKTLLVANKVDSETWEPHASEAASLGFGEPQPVSATTGHGVREFIDALYAGLPETTAVEPGEEDAKPEFTIAIVGKRNAGKSTLLNALAGETRAIVSEIAGTTRDSIDVRFDFHGHTMTAIDTAGLRKRKSMKEDVEYYAFRRAIAAVRRADVCMLMIDATEPVSQVDKKLAQELLDQFKPTIIVLNKWDKVDPKKASPDDFLEYLTKELRGLEFAPIVLVSAKEAEGLRELVAVALNLYQQASHRESTGSLNAALERIMALRGPSSRLGTEAKLYYASQVSTNPPTIVLMVNQPKLFQGQYERFLLNRLREELPYSEVPIRLLFRSRRRKSVQELKEGQSHRASRP